MATASGIDAQLGLATESAFATRTTPTRFYELVDESLKCDITRIRSKGIRPGRRTPHRWAPGTRRVTGDFNVELPAESAGLAFTHIFGSVNTTGSGPYTHTYTPGPIDGKSVTIQVGRPDITGTVQPFDYIGCKFLSSELVLAIDEYVMWKNSIYGVDELTNQSLASATYDTGLNPFVFTHGNLTVAGSELEVIEVSFKMENGLKVDRHRISATTPHLSREPKENELRTYSGTLKADFTMAAYNRFKNGTEAALVLTCTQGADASFAITANVRFDGETPNVSGHELIELSLPFEVTSGTSDAAAVTAVLTNQDATP